MSALVPPQSTLPPMEMPRYLAITDHGEDLTINGVSPRQMLAQRKELATHARPVTGTFESRNSAFGSHAAIQRRHRRDQLFSREKD